MNKKTIAGLTAGLNDASPYIRLITAIKIGRLGDGGMRLVPALVRRFEIEQVGRVTNAIAYAAEMIGQPAYAAFLPLLAQKCETSDDKFLRANLRALQAVMQSSAAGVSQQVPQG